MITKQQLAQAWNTFSEKMAELRKRRQEIVVAYDKEKTREKIHGVYRKIAEMSKNSLC